MEFVGCKDSLLPPLGRESRSTVLQYIVKQITVFKGKPSFHRFSVCLSLLDPIGSLDILGSVCLCV